MSKTWTKVFLCLTALIVFNFGSAYIIRSVVSPPDAARGFTVFMVAAGASCVIFMTNPCLVR